MCRHLAYLGPPVPLRSVLIDPPHSLYRQSWAPRRQAHGTVNADGFGIGWYADGDLVPARYRQGVPIWVDQSLMDIARVTRSAAVLAAVRSATPGAATGAEAAAPFGSGPWLFSHNGVARDWRALATSAAFHRGHGTVHFDETSGDADPRLDAGGTGGELGLFASLESLVDSAFLWALVLARLRAGHAMPDALSETIEAVEAAGGTGRFNFLLTDGRSIAATACGDTLWYRRSDTDTGPSVVVASEPFDDDPSWTEVSDRHLLTATPLSVSLQPLPAECLSSRRNEEGTFA